MSNNLPLLVPSYNRPDAPIIKLAKEHLGDTYPWWIFVRKSQKEDYLHTVPRENLVVIQDSKIDNLGKTRNLMLRWARKNGFNRIFDWDDDVFRIGRKLPDGTRHMSIKRTGTDPSLLGSSYWEDASIIANDVFDTFPGAVAGSIQNQRWAKTASVTVQCGKTPRRTKILEVDRLLDNGLTCPEEFKVHGEDIGNTALYLEYGWQIFTICSLVYDFVPETDVNLPSTLRSRDEEKNRKVHAEEFANLQNYDIKDYLRINKSYSDGSYMYGDVDWRKFRKLTGQESRVYEYTGLTPTPLSETPYKIL